MRMESQEEESDAGEVSGSEVPLVLIVDPDAAERRWMCAQLATRGYQVSEAADAGSAIAALERQMPRLLLQSLRLPDRDGLAVAEHLRQRPGGAAVPVIGLAGRDDALDELRAMRGGVSAVLFRPIESGHLLRVVQANLAGPWTEGAARAGGAPARRSAMKSAQLEVLARTSDELARHGSVYGALGACVEACLGIADITGGALYLVDRERGELRLELQQGFGLARLERADPGERLVGAARGGTRVCAMPSPAVEARATTRLLRELGVASALHVPLAWAGHVYGVLLLGARGAELLAADSIAFAELIATHLAQAFALGQTLERLSGTEKRYRAILQHAHDAICLIDDCGFIFEANHGFELVTGRRLEEIIGRHIRELAAPGQAAANLENFRRALHQPGGAGAECRLAGPAGEVRVVSFFGSVIELEGRRVVVAMGRDVTEQQRAHAQLMVSDRMASVGMLAAGVAHEINNPLAAVLANLEMAARDAADLGRRAGAASELAEEVMDAREGAERVRQIVRDLRIVSRAEVEATGPVCLHRVLDSAARMAWNELRHRAQVVKEFERIPAVLGNESRLGQVFLNLIVNAAQAIPEGHADDNQITLRTRVAAGRVVVEVSDTGAGMSPEVMGRLFTPFFTTKPIGVGTGLGLSICQRIVNAAGGQIEVESEPGKGTTFRVVLPAPAPADALPPTAAAAGPALPAQGRRGRILVVDDDALVVRLIHRILATEHDVTTVASAQEALDLVAAGERFDVILCDVMMPQLTGMDMHARLLASAPEQAERIVFVTGGAFTPAAREFIDQVENQRIEKPFDPLELRGLVTARVEARAPAP
jgi:PAS domain S-box-containing protein